METPGVRMIVIQWEFWYKPVVVQMTFWHWICDNTLFKSVTSQLSDNTDSTDPRIDVDQISIR